MPTKLIKQFLKLESSSGIILFAAAILALIWANSPFKSSYLTFTHQTFLFLINEGLMAFFFLIVALELKRSFCEGKFRSPAQIALPGMAALGGMIIPALIYIWFNYHSPLHFKGWAIPVATDIAFALGVLTLFGNRVPLALKLFLLALAIFDDIGAILIIAIVYSQSLSFIAFVAALCTILILYILNRYDVSYLSIYLLCGLVLWYALYRAGIHPTVAGVIVAFMVPYHDSLEDDNARPSPLHRLEANCHPWVAYLIMPLFALANAGFSFSHITYHMMTSSLVLGIAIGLFLGKQIGVAGCSWLLIRLKIVQLPDNTTWLALYGVAILCGIGFTMSLFLGTLSFQNEGLHLAAVRLGVMMGSFFSGVFGALVLLIAFINYAAQEDSIE